MLLQQITESAPDQSEALKLCSTTDFLKVSCINSKTLPFGILIAQHLKSLFQAGFIKFELSQLNQI